MLWSTACSDWEARILSGSSLVPDLPLYQAEADRALRVFKRLKIPDMVGMPRMGMSRGHGSIRSSKPSGGSLDPETNIRAIQEFSSHPQKNTRHRAPRRSRSR
jgi:phage terminase large subunit-like protein